MDLTLTNSYFGPGVRYYLMTEAPRVFVQGNVLLVDESAEAEQGGVKISNSKSGAGAGLTFGVDLRASKLISIPISAHYLYAKPADDVSGLGFSVGVSFNFGSNR